MIDLALAVQTACTWEATARKAGNVHPFARFKDLTYDDFIKSATAIAPVLKRTVKEPLGITVLEAIRATRAVVDANTNLGMVLLLAPLSKCSPMKDGMQGWREQLAKLIDATTIDDAKHVYEAIRLAAPGSMGKVAQEDVATTPTKSLRDVMALAADRDLIARQYDHHFADVLAEGVPALMGGWEQHGSVESAILTCQLHWLSRFPDSLIVRKLGLEQAREVQRRAQAIDLTRPDGRRLYAELDGWLRADGHTRNPGTTADLITACLFIALCEDRLKPAMPFTWN